MSQPNHPYRQRTGVLTHRSSHDRRFLLIAGLVLSAGSLVSAADETSHQSTDDSSEPANGDQASRIIVDSAQIQAWRIGLVLETPVTCTNVLATFPVPADWPEQKVKVTGQTIDPQVTAWKVRELPTGAKQVVLQMPRVTAGSTVEITFTLEIERSRILAPEKTDDLVAPKRTRRDLRLYFGDSPNIDASNPRIKLASKELAEREAENDWQRVEQIYDYVREKVQYVEGSLKNASVALRDGTGDCEEMTSLFVAMCRNAGVPARMVWIPDHCYPEFYLEDGDENGYWFPCQAAGTRQFGRMDEYRPVLQKGDRFKVPEKTQPVRYVAEYFSCDKKGKSDPRPKFIRERIDQ